MIFTAVMNQHWSTVQKFRVPICLDVMQQESVSESPQERREFLTSLPNLSENDVFRLLHCILLLLIGVTICFGQTTLNPGCIVSHPVVVSSSRLRARQKRFERFDRFLNFFAGKTIYGVLQMI